MMVDEKNCDVSKTIPAMLSKYHSGRYPLPGLSSLWDYPGHVSFQLGGGMYEFDHM